MKMHKILFLLSARALSGGVLVVRQHAKLLAQKGYEVTVSYLYESDFDNCANEKLADVWPAREVRHADLPADEQFDVAVATWWETAYHISTVKAKGYAYYVQGFESRMYPPDSVWPLLVERTFQADFEFIAVNSGLQKHLQGKFNRLSKLIPPGIDTDDYACAPRLKSGEKLRVLVEGSPDSESKRVEFAFDVLSHVPAIEVVYVSPSGKGKPNWRMDHFFESVPHAEIPSICRSCDVILKLNKDESFSMPVLEAFAAGATAIAAQFHGGSDYIVNGKNALVVPVDDTDAAVKALIKLKDDRELLSKLKEAARITAHGFNWRELSTEMESVLQKAFEASDRQAPPLAGCLEAFLAAHSERLENMQLKADDESLRSELIRTHFEIAQLKGEVSALKSEVSSLRNSRSYRIGNGLAKVYRHVTKVRR